LIIGGAVQIDTIKQLNPELMVDLNACFKIKLGKRTYFKVI
jgi:tyrosyl-tRNA synthetase